MPEGGRRPRRHLINNAGLARGLDLLHEGSHRDWDEMIDTNIKGVLNMTRALLPAMVARDEGHVVNVGSIAGHATYPRATSTAPPSTPCGL